MRIKSEIWVKAYLRQCQVQGLSAVVVRRGDEHAGAIYICLNRLDGTVKLYTTDKEKAVIELPLKGEVL